MPRRAIRYEQRLAHQGVEKIKDDILVDIIESAYCTGTLDVESPGEYRTPFQQRLLRIVEVVVGPRHGVAQRLVACQPAPGADQQPEPVIKAITHFTGGHRRHPRRREFDGQWYPIQALTNLGDCGGFITIGHREVRRNALSAFDEQAHRRRVDSRCRVQRAHRPHLLVRRLRVLRGWWPGFVQSPSARVSASIRSAATSRTCSQLSITNSRTRPSNAVATDSLTLLPGCWLMPSTAATASGTAAGSVTAASSKTHTPSGKSSARCAATSVARRVLPTPPHRSTSPADEH